MSTENFVQQFDVVPQFWQFLRGLSSNDLIIELIQNELDAKATHTSIAFYSDRLVCQGNGEPVSESGWRRLAYVMGAGDQVESKQFSIGVKNHGLKACFRLGDEIILRSDGRRMTQTLYKDGRSEEPSPGTLQNPVPDEEAPLTGCSVEIPFRTRKLTVSKGEPFELMPTENSFLERLFRDAYEQLPKRLLGIVRPGIRDQYTLSLSHSAIGSVEFHWRAKRGKYVKGKGGRRYTLFSRECHTVSGVSGLPSETLHEQACAFKVLFPVGARREIPDFFALDKRSFLSEIAWLTDRRLNPKATKGIRRYPIGYEVGSESALTGAGVYFSGPYRSDAERHGVSEQAPLNDHIDNACRDALVDIMGSYLLHKHGGKVMELYMADPFRAHEESLKDFVERTVEKRCVPLKARVPQASTQSKSSASKHRKSPPRLPLGPRRFSNGDTRWIVLPMFTWDKERTSPLLSEICPSGEDQIDSRVPGPILHLLARNNISDATTITFDEKDAIDRLQPQLDSEDLPFPWSGEAEWKASLGNPRISKQYLDVVYETIQARHLDFEQDILENVYLPDEYSAARPLVRMFSAVNLPPDLGERKFVPILHPDVRDHRLLARRAWKPKPFTLDDYLATAQLETASLESRKSFWLWLRENWRSVEPNTLQKIARLPIWPSTDGDLLPLEALCEPNAVRVTSIMNKTIRRPSSDISEAGLFNNKRGTRQLRFRSVPTVSEIAGFLAASLSVYPLERPLTSSERREFHKLEEYLSVLAAIPELRKHLSELSSKYAVALATDGTLKSPQKLVRSEGTTSRLHLPARHIIDRTTRELDQVEGWAPRPSPAASQIVDAIREDANRTDVHIQRIQEYVKQAAKEGLPPDGLRDSPCIPMPDGKQSSPSQIALRGKRDFWGKWKEVLPVTGINAEVQGIYTKIGVVGGELDANNSWQFFRWLSSQTPQVIATHINQVLRHIGHRAGPRAWADEYPIVPFIPVEADSGGVRLVTRAEATKRGSEVVIPDFESLEVEIRKWEGTRPVNLAIVESPRVIEPITGELRNLGLRTLSGLAGEPLRVVGEGHDTSTPDLDFGHILDSLRSGTKGQQLRKRLDSLDFDTTQNKLKNNWRERLSFIQDVKTADSVSAAYRLSRTSISVPVAGKFDKSSGVLWLEAGPDIEQTLFDVIGDHIFETPQRYLGPVLYRAYRMEVRERNPNLHTDDGAPIDDVDCDGGGNDSGGAAGGLSATSGTHSVPKPDPSRNFPKPGPIPTGPGSIKNGNNVNRTQSNRPQSPEETAQIEDIKENQYAWHCQVCLSTIEPKLLAPPSSYVELHHNRQPIMHAHHCDQVHAGGARHAGNLLLLCSFHHSEFGDAVSRVEVIQSLHQATEMKLTFSGDNGVLRDVNGNIATIHPPQRPAPFALFFTKQHKDYWLTKASEEGLI